MQRWVGEHCIAARGGGRRSRQLTFQSQIPHATLFRFRRLRCRFRMPQFCQIPQIPLQIPRATVLPDSADSAQSVSDSADSACHGFARFRRFRRFRFRFRMPHWSDSADSADSATESVQPERLINDSAPHCFVHLLRVPPLLGKNKDTGIPRLMSLRRKYRYQIPLSDSADSPADSACHGFVRFRRFRKVSFRFRRFRMPRFG